MSTRLLTADLWNKIQDFLPEDEPSPLGGRPRADNRTVLTCIPCVLKTASPGNTCHGNWGARMHARNRWRLPVVLGGMLFAGGR